MDRLTPLDQLMLGASKVWPQDIGALAVLDGSCLFDAHGCFRIEAVREAIQHRLHLVPRFRQVVHSPQPRVLGPPLWVDSPTFDSTHHVHEFSLDPPAGEAELLSAVEHLRCDPLDPSHPLWEMWFITGLPERRVGLFVKIHHSIADGMAAMASVVAFLDPFPDLSGVAPPWTPAPLPTPGQLLADNIGRRIRGLVRMLSPLARPRATLRQLHAAWPAVRELFSEEPGPETSFDRMVGPNRNLATICASLDMVKEAAQTGGATVNDVLLTVTAGGLRALLQLRGEPVPDVKLPIYVPVSLRGRPRGPQQGNLISQMVVPLPLGSPDPAWTLVQIANETRERKKKSRLPLGALFRGRHVRRLLLKAIIRQRVNVTSACIRGPERPLYLAGARVLEVYPVLPLIANEALGVGSLSYAGKFTIGIVADRDAYPDLDVFAAAVRQGLHDLGVSTYVPSTGCDGEHLAPDDDGELVADHYPSPFVDS